MKTNTITQLESRTLPRLITRRNSELMKYSLARHLIVILLLLGIIGCSDKGKEKNPIIPEESASTSDSSATLFVDSHLENSVRQALKQPEGPLTITELLLLTELDAQSREVTDLSGIGNMKNLTTLNLANNKIKDLTPLAALVRLKFLDLSNNQVSDISAISTLSEIEVLILSANAIQEISTLQKLVHLQSVELSGNPLTNETLISLIPALQSRGIQVVFQPDERQEDLPHPSSPNFSIAFLGTMPNRKTDIYTMGIEGSAPINLTNNPGRYGPLAWSPDGTKIAFVSQGDPLGSNPLGSGIFLMDKNGNNLTKLTSTSDVYGDISWSPTSSKLVFSKGISGDIFVMEVDGSNVAQLTNDPAADLKPSWSPDGSKIAFARMVGSSAGDPERYVDIFVMNADGTSAVRVTDHPTSILSGPIWSPEGTKIAFSMTSGSEPYEVYVVDIETKVAVNLSNSPAKDDENPSWSPDGTEITFSSNRDGNWEIYVINVSSSSLVNLTNSPAQDLSPQWSPDGSKIAFLRIDQGKFDIYMVNADGSQSTNLTQQNPPSEGGHVWAPK